jgi:hypothetical protein
VIRLNIWTKPSFSNGSGGNNCADVLANELGDVFIRNSNDPHRDTVHFNRAEWEAFLAGVKAGEFDLP